MGYNKEQQKEYAHNWKSKNREKVKAQHKIAEKKRLQNPAYKVRVYTRCRISTDSLIPPLTEPTAFSQPILQSESQ